MRTRKTIRIIHLASTVWFMLCTGYVFILALWQAGFNWLVIFSLSGYWALIITLLVSVYLFAVFRGASPGLSMQKEHPLTSTAHYMAFYISAPFLGAIGGVLSMIGETGVNSPLLSGVALGTIGATFLTWIVVDPAAGLLELLAPEPRKHRVERFVRARMQKQLEEANRKQMLIRIAEQEHENERQWKDMFAPQAERLARLLASDGDDFARAEQDAIDIGVEAWRTGGLICMKYLRNTAADIFRQRHNERQFVDYTSAWWDGIGRWRNPSPVPG